MLAVRAATKIFSRPSEQVHTFKERVLHPLRSRDESVLTAVDGVSFDVAEGEFFGIVGRNGSGKSTLLKCLAGIYQLDAGTVHARGRISAFIELGVGFNPDLTAYDNVVTNGIMLGLTPREARRTFDQVIEFAELEEFVQVKLKNYSSGMYVRLAFAVMVQVDADIMLIDEVLAVGDAAFQQKCFDVFTRLRHEGKTIVFVTHDMAAVERFCHRALVLEEGVIVASGAPRKVAAEYFERNFARPQAQAAEAAAQESDGRAPRGGDGGAHIEEIWVQGADGQPTAVVQQEDRCAVRARVRFARAATDPSFAVALVNEHDQNHVVFSTESDLRATGAFAAGEEVELDIGFHCVLGRGRYHLSMVVAHQGAGTDLMDRWERAASFVVVATRSAGGLVDLPHEVTVRRA